jgi:hypothetical protein
LFGEFETYHRECKLDEYALIECIDEGLDLFGPSLRYTVYWRMIVLHNTPREGILANPAPFVEGLRDVFGAGAEQIEIAIVEKIKERFGMKDFKSENLVEIIENTRKQIALVV